MTLKDIYYVPKIKSDPKADIQDGRQNTVFLLKCMNVAF